jgi:hypothetical protein
MLRHALRGVGAAARRGLGGPASSSSMRHPATIVVGYGGYPPTACRAFAAAKGKGAKEDKAAAAAAASGGATAAAKLNALTMAIKRIEHLHGKGACVRA